MDVILPDDDNGSGLSRPKADPTNNMRTPLDEILARVKEHDGRFVVLLAGAPGVGKSTLAQEWEANAGARGTELQCLPMDGFHLPNRVLDERRVLIDDEEVSLRQLKGSPESYDLDALLESLRRLYAGDAMSWPRYDRELHEPVADAIEVIERGVVVVEGNYLLLDEPGWRDAASFAHRSAFLDADEDLARRGLVERHVRGGRSRDDAERHYAFNDQRNRHRVEARRLAADHELRRD
jgi:pantothenate kinase